MIEVDKTDAGIFVRMGPFETEEQARHAIDTLKQLSAEGWAVARERLRVRPRVLDQAIDQALEALGAAPGHFILRGDGGPGQRLKVQLATGTNFEEPKAPKPTATR